MTPAITPGMASATKHRRLAEPKIVLASHNQGKLAELRDLLAPYSVEVVSAPELGLDEPEETGATYLENAELKAHAAASVSGLPCLADDSGISVTALNGDPGIYSARWAETADGSRDFTAAMRKVNDALGDSDDRSAAFISMIVLAWPDGHSEAFEGRVEGQLIHAPTGEHGFGYDPIFVPDGETRTFAEMLPHEKKELSHRARALRQLLNACVV